MTPRGALLRFPSMRPHLLAALLLLASAGCLPPLDAARLSLGAAVLAYDAAGAESMGTVVAPVPEAASSALTLLAGAALTLRRRRSLSV